MANLVAAKIKGVKIDESDPLWRDLKALFGGSPHKRRVGGYGADLPAEVDKPSADCGA